MPIAVQCTGCKQRLRVPDKVAGKRIRCPKCQTVLRVPKPTEQETGGESKAAVEQPAAEPKQAPQAERQPPPNEEQSARPKSPSEPKRPTVSIPQDEPLQTAPSTPASAPDQGTNADVSLPDRWYLKTEDGEDYGPVPKAELDQWRDEGRITADCHVLQDGADQWQWASDLYPELEADESAPAVAGPPPLKAASPQAPVTAPTSPEPETVDASTFQFAAADASPTLRAKGKKRVRKIAKKTVPATTPASVAVSSARPVTPGEVSPKSKMVAGLLGIFLGGYGIHRFYLGYTGLGLIMLFTCGGCGIWALIDAIMIFMGSVPDAQGRPLRD